MAILPGAIHGHPHPSKSGSKIKEYQSIKWTAYDVGVSIEKQQNWRGCRWPKVHMHTHSSADWQKAIVLHMIDVTPTHTHTYSFVEYVQCVCVRARVIWVYNSSTLGHQARLCHWPIATAVYTPPLSGTPTPHTSTRFSHSGTCVQPSIHTAGSH